MILVNYNSNKKYNRKNYTIEIYYDIISHHLLYFQTNHFLIMVQNITVMINVSSNCYVQQPLLTLISVPI